MIRSNPSSLIASLVRAAGASLLPFVALAGCNTTPSEPAASTASPAPSSAPAARDASVVTTTADNAPASSAVETPAPSLPVGDGGVVQHGGTDPVAGKFSLADATKGMKGTGALSATIDTTKGAITCKLYDDKAPNTVANFVGLARGARPWKDPKGDWVKRPAYDGTTFHRVI